MKWVLLGLYSDSYTTPDVMFFHTETDVLKFISDTCTEWEEPRVEIGYIGQSSFSNERHMRVTIDDDCGNFYVCEVFPIKKTTNYIAIEYHAYEGVDFKRTECITEEEAKEVIDKSFNKIIEDRYNTLSRYLLKYFDSHDVMTRQDAELIIQSLENKSFEFVSLYADGEKIYTDVNEVSDE